MKFIVIAQLLFLGFNAGAVEDDPRVAACKVIEEKAKQDIETILASNLVQKAEREQQRERKLLESIKPKLASPGKSGKPLGDVILEANQKFDAAHAAYQEHQDRDRMVKEYRAAAKPLYGKFNEIVRPFIRPNTKATCPAGSTKKWTEPEAGNLYWGFFACLRNRDQEKVEPDFDQVLWVGGEGSPSEHLVFVEHGENLSKSLKRPLSQPVRFKMSLLMKLRTGEIGHFDAGGTLREDWPSDELRLAPEGHLEVSTTVSKLKTEEGRAELKKKFVEAALLSSYCLAVLYPPKIEVAT